MSHSSIPRNEYPEELPYHLLPNHVRNYLFSARFIWWNDERWLLYVNIYNISKYSVCNWFICFNFPWNLKPLCFVQWKYIWYVENITKTFIFFHIILLWYFNSNSISGFKISLFELEVKIQHLLLCHMKFEKKLNEMFIYRWICSMIQK